MLQLLTLPVCILIIVQDELDRVKVELEASKAAASKASAQYESVKVEARSTRDSIALYFAEQKKLADVEGQVILLNHKIESLQKLANMRGELIEKCKQRVATLEKELNAKNEAQGQVRQNFLQVY